MIFLVASPVNCTNEQHQRKMSIRNHIHNHSPPEEKISLFRSLFRGRDDVYPCRFESVRSGKSGYTPACANEWVRGVCEKPKVKCATCTARKFLPVTDETIRQHLTGFDPAGKPFVMGVYPMLLDESCFFLAVDFDGDSWQQDAVAYLETCQDQGIPAVLERSRSGNGGHIWLFFAEAIPAILARKLGALILTKTMDRHPGLPFTSYDRFFPNQDTLPKGGLGNLIALPLQHAPRTRGNSIFLDETGTLTELEPHPDQWKFLSGIEKIPRFQIETLVEEAGKSQSILGVRRVAPDDENGFHEFADSPWEAPPSRKQKDETIPGPLPKTLPVVLSDQIYLAKSDLPPPLRNRLVRLAAFQNPEFYKAQAMRFSTHDKPRIISCCEDLPKHIGLPRGCLEELRDLLKETQNSPEAGRQTAVRN